MAVTVVLIVAGLMVWYFWQVHTSITLRPETSDEASRRRIKRELAEIERDRPHYIVRGATNVCAEKDHRP